MDEQNNKQAQTQTTEKKKHNFLALVAVGIIVLVAVVGFLATRGATKPSTTEESNSLQTVANETPVVGGASRITSINDMTIVNMEAGNFYYNPKEIRVKKGQKVKIVMTSMEGMHTFVIDELELRPPVIKAGDFATVEFTADKAGTFEYYCDVGTHREDGQVGTLIVE